MDEFYRLNPKKMMRYQPFMQERMRQKHDDESRLGWMHGVYVSRAIGASMSKRAKYPQTPIDFYERPEPEEEAQPISDFERFKAFAMVYNAASNLPTLEEIIKADEANNTPASDDIDP